jgi:hypothetical protein
MSERESDSTPEEDNVTADEQTAKDGATLLTDEADTTSLTDGEPQKLPHTWMNGLTAEQKADPDLVKALAKFERGIPDISKAYVELEKKLSQSPPRPSKDATDEEKARWRESVGVPQKPEDYTLEDVELPAGTTVDTELRSKFLELAHGLDLTNAQTNAIYRWYLPMLAEQMVDAQKVVKTTMDEAIQAVRDRHKVDPEEATHYMERGFNLFATPGLRQLLESSGLGNHAEVIDFFIKVGKFAGEHKIIDPQRGEGTVIVPIQDQSFEQLAEAAYPTKKE